MNSWKVYNIHVYAGVDAGIGGGEGTEGVKRHNTPDNIVQSTPKDQSLAARGAEASLFIPGEVWREALEA